MPPSPARAFRPFATIKAGLVGSLAVLAVLLAFTDIMYIYQAHHALQASRRLAETVSIGLDLFQAVRSLGYERGRANVVLNHSGPLGEMADNRAFVLARRQEGEEHLERALAALVSRDAQGKSRDALREMDALRAEVADLRVKADAQMALEADRRDPGFAKVWFASTSRVILHIRRLLEEMCAEIAAGDGASAILSQLMLASIGLRDEAAPEMSILSGVMLSGRPIGEETRARIINGRGKTWQLWETMRVASAALGEAQVADRVEDFRRRYQDVYQPVSDRVLEAARQGGPYPVGQREFLAQGVAVLESLAETMQAVAEAGQRRTEAMQAQAAERFFLHLFLLAVSLLVVGALVWAVVTRLVTPLDRLAGVIQGIARRELEQEVPYRGRGDEVGEVAAAVEVLKTNTVTMIEDMEALERSRRELRQALDEVKALSGLLPICANCKKIRDDGGYWQQIEKYISERSQAQFSHGICPDCIRKLYPEFADEMLKGEDPSRKS